MADDDSDILRPSQTSIALGNYRSWYLDHQFALLHGPVSSFPEQCPTLTYVFSHSSNLLIPKHMILTTGHHTHPTARGTVPPHPISRSLCLHIQEPQRKAFKTCGHSRRQAAGICSKELYSGRTSSRSDKDN